MRNRVAGVAVVTTLFILTACSTHTAAQRSQRSSSAAPSATQSATRAPDPYLGWRVYHSTWEGTTLRYPPTWTAAKIPISTEGAGPGEGLRLSARDGFTLTWIAPLSGIGGGCDASKDPHIFIDRILTTPTTGSRNPLRIILMSVQRHKTLALVDSTSLGNKIIKVGDTGECLYYPIFRSKTHTDLDLLQWITGQTVQLGNGAESHDGNELLSDAQYLQLPDVRTALMIIRSLRY